MQKAQKVSCKVYWGAEIRRFPLAPSLSFQQLKDTISSKFEVKGELQVRYKDDEDDLVLISSDAELRDAMQFLSGPKQNILRLYVTEKGQPVAASVEAQSWQALQQQLQRSAGASPVVAAPPTAVSTPTPAQLQAAFQPLINPHTHDDNGAFVPLHQPQPQQQHYRHQLQHRHHRHHHGKRAPRARWVSDNMGAAHESSYVAPHRRDNNSSDLSASGEGGCGGDAVRGPKLKARFVAHVTVPDGTLIKCGEAFVKTWRVRNAGKTAWPPATKLLFIGKRSDHLSEVQEVAVEKAVEPGDTIDVSVPMRAPSAPGQYKSFWKLSDATGKKFGQRFWCDIIAYQDSEADAMDEKQWTVALASLGEMGFRDEKRNVELLREHHGDVRAVVQALVNSKAT